MAEEFEIDKVVCPHCGAWVDMESLPLPGSEEEEMECSECEKTFWCEPITCYYVSKGEE